MLNNTLWVHLLYCRSNEAVIREVAEDLSIHAIGLGAGVPLPQDTVIPILSSLQYASTMLICHL